jgi:hypothetical protein
VERPTPWFRGSELPRLVILSVIMVVGWVLVWGYLQTRRPEPAEPPVTVSGKPEPVVPDRSMEFETVTDRTKLQWRDNAAYALLLERARERTPEELAAVSRRDIVLTHLWERPELYRGVPVHLLGTALRVLRYESKLSRNGWLYEAWIITPDSPRLPWVCVFEEPPAGFPIGPNVSERVVFNGYFLKIMKYDAADVARGAPVLIGRIGWRPEESSSPPVGTGMSTTLRWTLIALSVMFGISLIRWIIQLRRLFAASDPFEPTKPAPAGELDPRALDAWVQSVAREEYWATEPDREADES